MSESTSPMLWGTIIFNARIDKIKVKYIALKIKMTGEIARFTTHVCKDEESGKHALTFTYRLYDGDNARVIRSRILLLLKVEMNAQYSRSMQEEGVIDWVISDNVTEP